MDKDFLIEAQSEEDNIPINSTLERRIKILNDKIIETTEFIKSFNTDREKYLDRE